MSRKNQPNEYKIPLTLASGANLEILIFSDVEHRWIFTHRYSYPENRERRETPTLINDTSLIVDYMGGKVQGINLSMNIIRPDKRGKSYWAGVDISPGSHLFIQFGYEMNKEGLFRMNSVDTGIGKRLDLDLLKEGLVKPVEFPFPLQYRVEPEYGVLYKVPFLKNNNEQAFFEFPKDYTRK